MLSEDQRPLRIYVCGPYTASTKSDVEKNVRKAIDVGLALFKKGHFPFIPHLTHYVDIRGKERNNAPTWTEYMERDLAWLEASDALYFIGRSKGADIELAAAFEWGLDIYYALRDVPDITNKTTEGEQTKMDKISNIKIKMECLLTEMYELGYEEGYEDAIKEFHIPG